MQITTTTRYHCTAVRMAKILHSENTKYCSCLSYDFFLNVFFAPLFDYDFTRVSLNILQTFITCNTLHNKIKRNNLVSFFGRQIFSFLFYFSLFLLQFLLIYSVNLITLFKIYFLIILLCPL